MSGIVTTLGRAGACGVGKITMTQDKDFKALVRARMSRTGQTYTAARAALEDERALADRFHARTIRTFMDGERLRSIPAKRRARIAVLLHLLERFDAGREYPEQEVNEVLGAAHEDFASLRRELVEYGYLTRANGIYRVADRLPERDPAIVQEAPVDEAARFRAATRQG